MESNAVANNFSTSRKKPHANSAFKVFKKSSGQSDLCNELVNLNDKFQLTSACNKISLQDETIPFAAADSKSAFQGSTTSQSELLDFTTPTTQSKVLPENEQDMPATKQINSRCVMLKYFDGDISDKVDQHFNRALSQSSTSLNKGNDY